LLVNSSCYPLLVDSSVVLVNSSTFSTWKLFQVSLALERDLTDIVRFCIPHQLVATR